MQRRASDRSPPERCRRSRCATCETSWRPNAALDRRGVGQRLGRAREPLASLRRESAAADAALAGVALRLHLRAAGRARLGRPADDCRRSRSRRARALDRLVGVGTAEQPAHGVVTRARVDPGCAWVAGGALRRPARWSRGAWAAAGVGLGGRAGRSSSRCLLRHGARADRVLRQLHAITRPHPHPEVGTAATRKGEQGCGRNLVSPRCSAGVAPRSEQPDDQARCVRRGLRSRYTSAGPPSRRSWPGSRGRARSFAPPPQGRPATEARPPGTRRSLSKRRRSGLQPDAASGVDHERRARRRRRPPFAGPRARCRETGPRG